MERSANCQNVDNYTMLSRYYDELLQDEEALSLWLRYIEEEKFHTVLELASGSGVMAGILKGKGYEVTASDISEEMRGVSRENYDGEYLILNMADYSLNRKYDLILCICDSINYLYEEELKGFFECACRHLHKGGRLIFDMHHPARIAEFAQQYIEEGYVKGVPYQWTIQSDEFEQALYEHFTFYTPEGMIQEHHMQNVFDPEKVKKIMSEWFTVEMHEDFVEEEKILTVGYRK